MWVATGEGGKDWLGESGEGRLRVRKGGWLRVRVAKGEGVTTPGVRGRVLESLPPPRRWLSTEIPSRICHDQLQIDKSHFGQGSKYFQYKARNVAFFIESSAIIIALPLQ